MNRLTFIIQALVLLFTSTSYAADLTSCNTLYHQHRYRQAITCYQKVDTDGPSAPLLYNIGNSYARLDHPGPAVLYFLRALYLSPGDDDILGNLELVRAAYGLFPPKPSVVQIASDSLTVSQWSLTGLSATLGYLVYAVYSLKKQRRIVVEATALMICAVIGITAITGTAVLCQYWSQSVVMVDGSLLISPYDGAPPIGATRQGRLARPLAVHRGFTYIREETGRTGWLSSGSLKPIIPRASSPDAE